MHGLRRLFPLIVVFFLLASCATAPAGSGTTESTAVATPKPVVTPTPTTLPKPGPEDVCPTQLRSRTGCLTPHAMRLAYGVEALHKQGFTGKGQTIIDIVSFGSPTLREDMEVFNKAFGLPPLDLEIIEPLKNVPEYDPLGHKGGWAAETNLDVQIIHAIAPEAKVVVLVSPVAEIEGIVGLPEFRQLEQYAIDNKLGNIVSHSWGASELTFLDPAAQEELKKWDDLLKKATQEQGMTYFASSGDEGATDYADMNATQLAKEQTTSFSTASPWVTSVGGTAIRRGETEFTESAWNGSGGGFSRFYSMPDYQKTLPADVQEQFKNRRGVPDVSGDADPRTGLAFYIDGFWAMAGGTSASAPLWAGIMALANQMAGRPLGFINPALYQIANSSAYKEVFHDVTVGNNTNKQAGVEGFEAVPGWDAVTGLGTPNAEKLVPELVRIMKK